MRFTSSARLIVLIICLQPPTEMSTRNLPVGKERPARKTDNLTANSEPIFKKMWQPRPTTGRALPYHPSLYLR
jgi:hypothetical protein